MTERPDPSRGLVKGALAIVAAGGVFYAWLLVGRANSAELDDWGTLGDAVAPFAALLNFGALLALLRSLKLQRDALHEQRRELRLQRKELRLQRKEYRESREEMARQRTEFERTAKAQEDLAKSQQVLAEAQEKANLLTLYVELAQRRANLGALLGVTANIAIARSATGQQAERARTETKDADARAAEHFDRESKRIAELERLLGLDGSVKPTGGS